MSELVPAAAAVRAEKEAEGEGLLGVKAPGDTGGGADPCDHWDYGPAEDCKNIQGSKWTTTHFWHSNTQKLHCPSKYGPVVYLRPLGIPFVQWGIIAGTSKFTSAAVGVQDSGSITITNDNTDGKHHSFTPVLLCCEEEQGATNSCSGEGGSERGALPRAREPDVG